MEKEKVFSYDGYPLCVHLFEVKQAKAVVQIIHGMEEHQERYEHLVKILNNAGLTVVSSDMRGHGLGLKKEDLGFFKEKKGYIALIQDQQAVTKFINTKFSNCPIYIFAHSMGTIITRVLLQNDSKKYDKVILSGYPNYRSATGPGVFVAKTIQLFRGARYKSVILEGLGVGFFNKKIKNPKTKVDWICANEETVQKYLADPYCGFGFSCSAFADLFMLVKMMNKPKRYKNVNKSLQILMLRGVEDPCTGGDKGAKKSREILKLAGFKNIKYIDYENMRHEIINERKNEIVFKDILAFLVKHTPKKNVDKKQTENFTRKYFEFYDDIKSHSHEVYDW